MPNPVIVNTYYVRCIGLDACPTGWVGVEIHDELVTAHYFSHVSEIQQLGTFDVIGIDIPIGLSSIGHRDCDVEGKNLLGRRSSTLFHVPVRASLEAASPEEASVISKSITGLGVSRQSYGLREKIFEVEGWMESTGITAFEVHPELSFRACTGAPIPESKKTWAGMVARSTALGKVGIRLDDAPSSVGARAQVDDMLDAGIVAWSATRIASNTAQHVGAEFKIWF